MEQTVKTKHVSLEKIFAEYFNKEKEAEKYNEILGYPLYSAKINPFEGEVKIVSYFDTYNTDDVSKELFKNKNYKRVKVKVKKKMKSKYKSLKW